jgi:hypothetical protein
MGLFPGLHAASFSLATPAFGSWRGYSADAHVRALVVVHPEPAGKRPRPPGNRRAPYRPGKPQQNDFVDSFNGKLRDECPSEDVFDSLAPALKLPERWRKGSLLAQMRICFRRLRPFQFVAQIGRGKNVRAENPEFIYLFTGYSMGFDVFSWCG